MLIAKIPYLGTGWEPEDVESELLRKTMKTLRGFNPATGRAYTFCYLAWFRTISTLMGKWKRSEDLTFIDPAENLKWEDDDKPRGEKLAYTNLIGRMDSDAWMDEAF